jgi:DNA mismatch endonuclease (patch repair protein)
MDRIPSRDTLPERTVRSALHRRGYRFKLHAKDLPGTPDVVLPRLRTALFVHGCFWHQHAGCRLARVPKARLEYWLPKFDRTKNRDKQNAMALLASGWKPLVVWECETTTNATLDQRLTELGF